jgi:acetylornithine deacetylase
VACHSSTPHLGDNAIYRMARVVESLAAHAKTLSQSAPDPVLGPPTLSVGRIEGGQSVNVVPDWCEVEVDRRVIPGESPLDQPPRVAAFLREQLGSLAEIDFLAPWVNMPALSANVPAPWLEVISNAVEKRVGRQPAVGGVPFGTDAGPLAQAGLPCLVFGPGDIAQAHTKDEWIELRELQNAADVYYDIACALGA